MIVDGDRRVVPPEEMRSTKNYLLHGLYVTLYSLVKYLAFPLSEYLRYAVLRLFAPHIHSAKIEDGVMIWFPWNVRIGKRCAVHQGAVIDGFGGVSIGDGVRIAAYTCINTADHLSADPNCYIADQGFLVAGVTIEDDVWIGSGTKINKGVRIGRGSVIGSGSVVTHDVPSFSIAAGVPCRVIRPRAVKTETEAGASSL